MKKQTILSLLLILITSVALNAQNTIAVIPFTGGAGREGNTIANFISDELVKYGGSKYAIAPRTTAINQVLDEHKSNIWVPK